MPKYLPAHPQAALEEIKRRRIILTEHEFAMSKDVIAKAGSCIGEMRVLEGLFGKELKKAEKEREAVKLDHNELLTLKLALGRIMYAINDIKRMIVIEERELGEHLSIEHKF